MLKLIRFIVRKTFKLITISIGFITAMLAGPGVLAFMYLYEPHRPLPPIISDLPSDRIEAALVMQERIDQILLENSNIPDVEKFLSDADFKVDGAANNAIYKRRQLNCIESYAIVWTETRLRLDKAAAIVDTRCSDFF